MHFFFRLDFGKNRVGSPKNKTIKNLAVDDFLTFKAPSKIVADNSLIFFIIFLEKIRLDISCELSA